jgi:sugar porter (SP) family MFS transporter
LVASILCAGALVGSFIAGPIANRFGRKVCVLVNNIPYIAGLLFLALAQNLTYLLVGRFLVGIGVGCACIGVPLYLTEISTVAARGILGSAHQLAIVTGIVVAELVALTGLYQAFKWRFMFALDLLPCLVQLIGLSFLSVESPRFLVGKHRIDEAQKALRRLRGTHFNEAELSSIIGASSQKAEVGSGNRDDMEKGAVDVLLPSEGETSSSWSLTDLLFRKLSTSYKSLLVATTLHVGQQVSGINSILLFSDSIFAPSEGTAPASSSTQSVVPLIIAFINFTMTVIAIFVIDRTGRRFLALTSSAVMTLSGVALTFSFVLGVNTLAIISVLLFVGAFAFGLGPVPWLMTNELFPTCAVGSAVSLAVATNWISHMVVTGTFFAVSDLMGSYAFLPYTLCMAGFFLFSLFLLPETKGRPVSFI